MALLTLLPPAEVRTPRLLPEVPAPQAPLRPSGAPRPHARRSCRTAPQVRRPLPRPVACGGARPAPARVRLTRRGRLVVALLWVVLAGVAAAGVLRPWAADAPPALDTRVVVVGPGETLWQVAGEATPGLDPRTTVATIVELNGLASAGDVRPGDRLVVPAG